MRGSERALVLLVLLSVLTSTVGVVALGAGSVAGQTDPSEVGTAPEESNSSAPTGSETGPTETETESGSEESGSDVVAQVDDRVRITSYSYDAEREVMSVTLEHTDPDGARAWATLTESVEAQEGGTTGAFGIAQVYVNPGETVTARVDAGRNSDGAAIVLVATQRSVEQGRGAFVSDVERPSLGLFEGSATWDLVRLGTIGGTLGVILVAILGAWHLVADSRDRAEVEI